MTITMMINDHGDTVMMKKIALLTYVGAMTTTMMMMKMKRPCVRERTPVCSRRLQAGEYLNKIEEG